MFLGRGLCSWLAGRGCLSGMLAEITVSFFGGLSWILRNVFWAAGFWNCGAADIQMANCMELGMYKRIAQHVW